MLGNNPSARVAACLIAGTAFIGCSGEEFSSAARSDGGPGNGGATGTGSSAGTSGKGGSSSGAGGTGGSLTGRGGTSGSLNAGGSSSGGAPSTGGSSGAGGASSTGGTGGTSAGSVTLVVEITGTQTYCDYIDGGCGVPASATHITVLDSARNPVTIRSSLCSVDCVTCQMLPCPGGGGPGAPGGPGSPCAFSTPFTGTTVPWDGGYTARSTCGAGATCEEMRYAMPGPYTAVMCATPGHMERSDAGEVVCIQTGGAQCVEVPFDYPGSGTVTGKLGN